MANFSNVVPNQLAQKAFLQKWSWRSALLMGVAATAWLIAPPLALMAIPAWWITRNIGGMARAGARGERMALSALRELPDTFYVFNQLRIPFERSKTGWLEADIVVVGPERLAVVEVKHNQGYMDVKSGGERWRTGLEGNGKSMRSPVAQVRRHATALGTWLRKQGKNGAWVEPAVYFSNERSRFSMGDVQDVSLIGHGELISYFEYRQPNDRPYDQMAVVETLKKLRQWRFDNHTEPSKEAVEPKTTHASSKTTYRQKKRDNSARPDPLKIQNLEHQDVQSTIDNPIEINPVRKGKRPSR